MVVRVDGIEPDIPWLEIDDLVRSGAHRLEVIRGMARLLPGVLGKEVPGQNDTPTTEGVIPERGGFLEHDLDGMVIELIDAPDVFIAATGNSSGGRVGDVLPGEDHIGGGAGLAIVPGDPLFEAPGD